MMRKKGDLSLSINAIVVLILAVVMLGLGLAFTNSMFKNVENQVKEQINQQPDPTPASAGDSLTVSKDKLVVSPGKYYGLKISLYNPTASPFSSVKPTKLVCPSVSPTIDIPLSAAQHDIAPGSNYMFVTNFKDANNKFVPENEYICSIYACVKSGIAPTPTWVAVTGSEKTNNCCPTCSIAAAGCAAANCYSFPYGGVTYYSKQNIAGAVICGGATIPAPLVEDTACLNTKYQKDITVQVSK